MGRIAPAIADPLGLHNLQRLAFTPAAPVPHVVARSGGATANEVLIKIRSRSDSFR
jgi:hypothetical protein